MGRGEEERGEEGREEEGRGEEGRGEEGGRHIRNSYYSTTLTISKLCSIDNKLICRIEKQG